MCTDTQATAETQLRIEGKSLGVFKKINGVWKRVAISISTNKQASPEGT
jgi:hypothetical protein